MMWMKRTGPCAARVSARDLEIRAHGPSSGTRMETWR